MPTLERLSISQSLSSVATKGRRLFSRDLTSGSAEHQSRASTPLRASALNLNEILEQNWTSASSPYCLSNQLHLPPLSAGSQSQSWGKDFGRRRSSNTTTTSISSMDPANDSHQRRRKSLFSKKSRVEPPSLCVKEKDDTPGYTGRFVDPFAREGQHRNLSQVSDLVIISAQSQVMPHSQTAASSQVLISMSPAACDGYFYPIDAPPSPTSPAGSNGSRASVVAFPNAYEFRRGYGMVRNASSNSTEEAFSVTSPSLSTMSATIDSTLQEDESGSVSNAEGFDCSEVLRATDQSQILLPSAMKRLSSRAKMLDAEKRSSTSLKAQTGHRSGNMPSVRKQARPVAISRQPSDWSLFEVSQPSLRPLPPLRPSRNPTRSRSKSLSSAKVANPKNASTPPPLPSPPAHLMPKREVSGVAAACDFSPVHTPPRSRRSSGPDRQLARCDSFASISSSSSSAEAPFHTPTFGSARWTTLPVS